MTADNAPQNAPEEDAEDVNTPEDTVEEDDPKEESAAENTPEGSSQDSAESKDTDFSQTAAPSMPESTAGKNIVMREIDEEMRNSYIDYAMSVIVGRALPDVRDGLKPVHRRVLYSMLDMGLVHNKPFKKSARIVGECLGKYHPHGDSAVYETLVRMAQDFSLRYPLVQGQGNFGSLDRDSPAAMRYTEARLSKVAEELLMDLNKETVPFVPNFDGSLTEPSLLPSKFPNLLVNGSSGIAVGMATNIPPHNLKEVSSAILATIENPEISSQELMTYVKGPDFPTGGVIYGVEGIRSAYLTGRGKVVIKAKADFEQAKERVKIVLTEIPYQVSKAQLVEEIATLVKDKRVMGISDIRDESDRDGVRVVVDLKRDADKEVVLNQLFAYSSMTYAFGVNIVALVNNEPRTLTLKDLIILFIRHRQIMVRKRTEFELKKAQERSHILAGLIIALDAIDAVIADIKKAKTVEDAKNALMRGYDLTETQAKAVLDMKLQKLSSLEQESIRKEQEEITRQIAEYEDILASEKKILGIITSEISIISDEYGDARRTQIDHSVIEEAASDMIPEDLIKDEDVVVTLSHEGYVKRILLSEYKQQNRGGKGMVASGTKEGDFISHLFIASTHSSLLIFTNTGQVHILKVHQIPEASRYAKGKPLVNLVSLPEKERVSAVVPIKQFDDRHYLVLATKNGTVKKTSLDEYSRPRQGGIIGITLEEGDDLVNAVLTDGQQNIMIATAEGMAVKFHEEDARPIGRTSKGVRGIQLREGDKVIGMVIARDHETLMTVTENGFGKRSPIEDYRLISRGGVGVINIQCTERNGKVVSIDAVTDEDEVMFISKNG